ncbi:MAG: hypothetical protein EA424_11520, partial [Planctomycetaceae bacterium]
NRLDVILPPPQAMPTVFTRLLILSILLAVAGCMFHDRSMQFDSDLVHYRALAREMPQPELNPIATGAASSVTPPRTVRDSSVPDQWWDLPWDEAVQLANWHSPTHR